MNDFEKWMVGTVICVGSILSIIITIMLLSYWTRAPYHPPVPKQPLCDSKGVWKTIDIKDTDGTIDSVVTVCYNGNTNIDAP